MNTPSNASAAQSTVVHQGFADCRKVARDVFGDYQWLFKNLTGEQRRDLHPIFAYLHHCCRLLHFTGVRTHPSTSWSDWRDEVRRAVIGKSDHSQLCALLDVYDRYEIPTQYLFDILDGVDSWIRFGKFETYEEWTNFASRIGGSTVLACVPVIGFDKPGYEEAAMHCGEAMMLTHILGRIGVDAKEDKVQVPLEDVQRCECELDQIKTDNHYKPFANLVRSLAARIEFEFFEANPLINFLSFDGQRIMRSAFAVHWDLLNKCKHDPFALIDHANELSRSERMRLRIKHMLGTEGKGIPILIAADDAH